MSSPHKLNRPMQNPGCWILFTGIFAVFQIISAIRVLYLPVSIRQTLSLSPTVDAVVHLALAALLISGAIGLARRRRFALGYTGWVIVAGIIYRIIRLLVFTQADYDAGRVPFLVAIAFMLLALPVFILARYTWVSIRRREVISYDGQS